MIERCTCRTPRGGPAGRCALCGLPLPAAAPLALTADASELMERRPRPTTPPTTWDEHSMWVPREVLEARADAVVADRYVKIGRRPLGAGAYGEVWKAYDRRLERWVALKLVKVADDLARRAVLAEAKTLGGLRHPHIVQLLDAGDVDDAACYLAMEFIDGKTLESQLGGPVVASARLVRDAALAVQHAHGRGFLHRDLKPRNLMLEHDRPGHVFVLDFGLARWMAGPRGDSAFVPVGTFAYMSPEQASGCEADARTDVYGLGATLYHLLTGRIYPPLEPGDSWMTQARKVLEHTGGPVSQHNPDVDAELDAIVARSLSKSPDARHGSARELADALTAWIDTRARPPAAPAPASPDLIAGRYRLLRPLSHGGFGQVYLAFDTRTEVEVVLKRHHDRSPAARARMLRGAQIQARVSHPFVVPLFDFGDDAQGLPFLVMRWVRDAQTLDRAALPARDKLRLLRDAAVAVHAIHELGYYRLDLKPANALVTGHPPLIQLVDLDLALHADDARDDDAIVGTPLFMSPEQVGSGQPLDRRTDVFSLGAILYLTLAGRHPLDPAGGPRELLAGLLENRLLDLRAAAPAVDAGLARLVMRCLAYDPAARFPTTLELAGALTRWLEGERGALS